MENQPPAAPIPDHLTPADQQPAAKAAFDASRMYPTASSTPSAVNPPAVQDFVDPRQAHPPSILFAPTIITILALVNILVSSYELLGPGTLYTFANGHVVAHHISLFAPIVAIVKYHAHQSVVSQAISLLVGLTLGIGLLKRSELARIITVVLLCLALVGLTIGMLGFARVGISAIGAGLGKSYISHNMFFIILWALAFAETVYLTRPPVKRQFK